MVEGIADCMPLALRSVGDAIRLDSENRTKEAYCQYLSCMIYISQVLKDDAWDKDLRVVYNRDTAKLFRLLQQCQERAVTIISTLANGALPNQNAKVQTSQHLQPPSDRVQQRHSDSSVVNTGQSDQSHLTPQSGAPRTLSDPDAQGSTLSTPSIDGYLHLPSPPGSPVPHHRRTGSYDPLERAYQENKHLIAAYRTRMQNANKGRRNKDVISKNLSLMRRMSENLVIAKAREEAIKKKLLERQQRLQEETNKRFGPAVLFTKEQQEQRILYTKILEFEQETVWPKHLREKLKLMPTNAKLIKDIITKIFCSADHPLTQFLLQYQYHVYRKLAPLVKDVGFPDVRSGKRATSKGTYITLSEAYSDEKPAETIESVHLDEGNRGNQADNAGSLSQSEDGENFSSAFNTEETINYTKEVVEEKSGEESYNAVENHDVASEGGEKNIRTNIDSEDLSSSTDLEKLKNLLHKGVPTDTSQAEDGQVDASTCGQDSSAMEVTDESTNFDSYFEELEDDMFGWESNGDENNDSDKENTVADDTDKITSEKTNCEDKEVSDTQNLESGTEDLEESTVVKDETSSSELDSLKCEKENLPDEANTDDSRAPDQIEPLKEKEIEAEHFDTNERVQPSDDVDPLKTNQFILSREERCTDDQTTSSNIDNKGEVQQMEPVTDDATSNNNSNEEASQAPKTADTPETPDEGEAKQIEPITDDTTSNDNNSNEEVSQAPNIADTPETPDEGEAKQIEPITDDVTSNVNSNKNASQTPSTPDTPDEMRESEVNIDSQGETQIPELHLSEESSGKNENDSVKKEDHSPTDEVRKQLKEILVDVRFFLEKLQNLLIVAYGPLDTPAGRDLCYSYVEFPFFKPLWPMLLAVLRQVNFDKEVCLADVISANISKVPFDLGVPQRLCLEDQEVLESTGNKYPYHMAVEELHKVVTLVCPLEKLECLVRTSRCICQCVEDYWESKGEPRHSPETAIGCDDLLPILSFVIIRSGMAQLVSECDAMEEFIPEGYLMGEEGYCLTTLLTALAYLATLKPT